MRWGSNNGVAESQGETTGFGAWERTNGVTGVWRGRWGASMGEITRRRRICQWGKMIRRSSHWQVEKRRGGRARLGGSCWRPRGVTCGTTLKWDLVVVTGCGGGRRCQAVLVTVSCEKTGEVEFGRVGRCGLAVVGLTRYEQGPLSNYSKIFN
jgi:hypothetical protein